MITFPDRSKEIVFHRENAYKYLKEKNYDMARSCFYKWVESVRQQNINTGGKLEKELEAAKYEQSEFAKTDPLYFDLCNVVIPKIKENNGILQTDLYKLFPKYTSKDIAYVLFFAAQHGRVRRIKKGRTYALSV